MQDQGGGADWRDYPVPELSPILAEALAEIVEHGYDGTTVRRIAQRVGVTVPALYYHFENKQAILRALLEEAMDIVLTHSRSALAAAGDDPVARFSTMVEAIVLYTAHHPDLAFLDSERRSLTAENLAHYVARRDELERELRTAVEDGISRGAFRTAHPDDCSRAVLAMCQGVAGWYRPDGPLGPTEVASRYVGIALAAAEHHPGGRQ